MDYELDGRVIAGYDFVRYTNRSTPDCIGHGTHVAGLLCGKEYGVAKGVTIVSVRVYGCSHRASVTAIVNALHWVLAHTTKLGVVDRSVVALMVSIRDEPPSVFRSVLNEFVRKQIPVIVPAGNHDPAAPETGNACDLFPAQMEDFITVGASAPGDGRAPFSNFGPCVNLYAPGANIHSAWHSSTNASRVMSGTTQATAIVTGATAVMLSMNIGLKAPVLSNILFSVSTPDVITDTPLDM